MSEMKLIGNESCCLELNSAFDELYGKVRGSVEVRTGRAIIDQLGLLDDEFSDYLHSLTPALRRQVKIRLGSAEPNYPGSQMDSRDLEDYGFAVTPPAFRCLQQVVSEEVCLNDEPTRLTIARYSAEGAIEFGRPKSDRHRLFSFREADGQYGLRATRGDKQHYYFYDPAEGSVRAYMTKDMLLALQTEDELNDFTDGIFSTLTGLVRIFTHPVYAFNREDDPVFPGQ